MKWKQVAAASVGVFVAVCLGTLVVPTHDIEAPDPLTLPRSQPLGAARPEPSPAPYQPSEVEEELQTRLDTFLDDCGYPGVSACRDGVCVFYTEFPDSLFGKIQHSARNPGIFASHQASKLLNLPRDTTSCGAGLSDLGEYGQVHNSHTTGQLGWVARCVAFAPVHSPIKTDIRQINDAIDFASAFCHAASDNPHFAANREVTLVYRALEDLPIGTVVEAEHVQSIELVKAAMIGWERDVIGREVVLEVKRGQMIDRTRFTGFPK